MFPRFFFMVVLWFSWVFPGFSDGFPVVFRVFCLYFSYGFLDLSSGFQGFPVVSMFFPMFPFGFPMVFIVFLWFSYDFLGFSHGFPRFSMRFPRHPTGSRRSDRPRCPPRPPRCCARHGRWPRGRRRRRGRCVAEGAREVNLETQLDKPLTGWWFKPIWKILINRDDYSQYMGK